MGKKRARSISEIRKIAEEILREAGITEPPVPVELIAKKLGATIRYSPFKGELAGMLIRNKEKGTAMIGVNSLDHHNRQRFTIAHECGHLRLHQGKPAFVDRSFRIDRRNELSSRATDFEEIEANRFAAELLMPYYMIRNDLMEYSLDIEDETELRELANRYSVSFQALMFRIQNVAQGVLLF